MKTLITTALLLLSITANAGITYFSPSLCSNRVDSVAVWLNTDLPPGTYRVVDLDAIKAVTVFDDLIPALDLACEKEVAGHDVRVQMMLD